MRGGPPAGRHEQWEMFVLDRPLLLMKCYFGSTAKLKFASYSDSKMQ